MISLDEFKSKKIILTRILMALFLLVGVVGGGVAFRVNFSYLPTFIEAGTPVQFTDRSSRGGTNWVWQFSDQYVTEERNPVHVFATAGAAWAMLMATDGTTTDTVTKSFVVYPELAVIFTWTPALPVETQPVQFVDQSTGYNIVSWVWDFGDGTPTSTLKNPIHTYVKAGEYTVTLTITNNRGSTRKLSTLMKRD